MIPHTQQARNNMSEAQKGRTHSEETKMKMSESAKQNAKTRDNTKLIERNKNRASIGLKAMGF